MCSLRLTRFLFVLTHVCAAAVFFATLIVSNLSTALLVSVCVACIVVDLVGWVWVLNPHSGTVEEGDYGVQINAVSVVNLVRPFVPPPPSALCSSPCDVSGVVMLTFGSSTDHGRWPCRRVLRACHQSIHRPAWHSKRARAGCFGRNGELRRDWHHLHQVCGRARVGMGTITSVPVVRVHVSLFQLCHLAQTSSPCIVCCATGTISGCTWASSCWAPSMASCLHLSYCHLSALLLYVARAACLLCCNVAMLSLLCGAHCFLLFFILSLLLLLLSDRRMVAAPRSQNWLRTSMTMLACP